MHRSGRHALCICTSGDSDVSISCCVSNHLLARSRSPTMFNIRLAIIVLCCENSVLKHSTRMLSYARRPHRLKASSCISELMASSCMPAEEPECGSLSHRAEVFRSKLIEDFQILDCVTEQGREKAPVYNALFAVPVSAPGI